MNVAVVGGGYAGLAAAVTLADAGVAVSVFEGGAELGGRARRVVVNGVALDNGCHILLGAYRETLRLIERVHATPREAIARLPLDWRMHRRFRLKAPRLPAPLHLAAALLTVRGAPWRERLAAARFIAALQKQSFILDADTTVSALLADHLQGPSFVRNLWRPLCIAALNTPPERASAQVFANVLRDTLAARASASDLVLARSDLSALFPDPAAAYVRARGGMVETGKTITAIVPDGTRLRLHGRGGEAHYDHVICAVSPHRATALLSGLRELEDTLIVLGGFAYQPIYTVYLQLTSSYRLPAPMLGMDGLAQWLFDREALCGQRGLIAAVISAEGEHQRMTQEALALAVHEEIERELGALPPLAWHRVIAEKRATFECTVGLERPATRTPLPNVHLAGDYVAGDYPATIEGAVLSGIAAAKSALGQSGIE